jgi:hypothetical protein
MKIIVHLFVCIPPAGGSTKILDTDIYEISTFICRFIILQIGQD